MFDIGDKVVYPMHGAGIIVDIEKKEILGEIKDYLIMQMPIGDMKVMIPVDNVVDIGVRSIIEVSEVDELVEILKGHKTSMPDNWNRRYRENMDRIKSGDIYEIAEVVRNLMMLDTEKGLSTGERKMLTSAKQMLLSEICLVKDLTIDEVDEMVCNYVLNFDEDCDYSPQENTKPL